MLLDAIVRGRLYQVKFLLESGSVNVNATDCYGQTPLMKAILLEDKMHHTRYKIVRLLLEHGAKVNSKDKNGKTALILAVMRGQKDVTERILRCSLMDIDLNVGDDEGNTALIYAALKGHETITEMLITSLKRFGLDIDKKNNRGLTAMLAAVRCGQEDCARVLLLQGSASLTIRDPDNFMNATEWAVRNQLYSFLELIEITKEVTAPLKAKNLTDNINVDERETPMLEMPVIDSACSSRPVSPRDGNKRPASRKKSGNRGERLTVPRVMHNLRNQVESPLIVVDKSRVSSPNELSPDGEQHPFLKETEVKDSRSELNSKSSRSLLSSRRSYGHRLNTTGSQLSRCSSAKTEIQSLLSIYGAQSSFSYRKGYDPTSLPPSGMWPDPSAVEMAENNDNINFLGESDFFGESSLGFARRSVLSNPSSRRMSIFGANQPRDGRRMSIVGQGNGNCDRRVSIMGRKLPVNQMPPQRNMIETLGGRKPGDRRMSVAPRASALERPTLRRINTNMSSPPILS